MHCLLPRNALFERLPVGRHALVGGVVDADLGRQVPVQPAPELGAECRVLRAVGEVHSSMPLNEIGRGSPSPPFRGERKGPTPQAWEGEVGGDANQHVGPPHPTLSPGRRVEREKKGSGQSCH